MTDELTERVARAICVAETGHDSDWRNYSDAAREAIHVVNEAEADELDRLRAALARTEANRDAAMQDATEEHERAERLRAEVERLKGLLGRYADHVDDEEGTDFLGHHVWAGSPITEDEAREIASYCPSAALQETGE